MIIVEVSFDVDFEDRFICKWKTGIFKMLKRKEKRNQILVV